MIRSKKKHVEKFSSRMLGQRSNACRSLTPGESSFSADYRTIGTDELMEQPNFRLTSPNVDKGKVLFLKGKHILIKST